jgi:hypothetical protein
MIRMMNPKDLEYMIDFLSEIMEEEEEESDDDGQQSE